MLVFHVFSPPPIETEEPLNPPLDDSYETAIFYFQEIFIGNASFCHIKIPHFYRGKVALRINHFQEGALVQSIDEQPFLMNGKKIVGTKVWRQNQSLEISGTTIKLVEIDFSQSFAGINIPEKYDEFQKNHPDHESILTALERELFLADE